MVYLGILAAAALVPPLFLIKRIYNLDKIEHEPVKMMIRLFLLGALAILPAMVLEEVADFFLIDIRDELVYQLLSNFLGVALIEEGCKYFFLKKGSWKSPEFNYRFDGVVYSTAVSLGFAALENLMYVLDGGLGTAALRAVLSIPGHCIFGIYMGYSYGMAKYYFAQGDKLTTKRYLRKTLWIPVLLHGIYDFCLSVENGILLLFFFAYIIVLDIRAFRRVRQSAAGDEPV